MKCLMRAAIEDDGTLPGDRIVGCSAQGPTNGPEDPSVGSSNGSVGAVGSLGAVGSVGSVGSVLDAAGAVGAVGVVETGVVVSPTVMSPFGSVVTVAAATVVEVGSVGVTVAVGTQRSSRA